MGVAADSMGTLGLVGGGQLARMTALAARSLGYRVHALDPNPECSVAPLVERLVVADFHDVEAGVDLARGCDVVTLDLENVSVEMLEAAAEHCPVRPGPRVLQVIQDRGRQKQWLQDHGFPVGPFRVAEDAPGLQDALGELEHAFVKATRGGFDGRGQMRASADSDAAKVLREVGADRVIAERALELKDELSVLVARRPGGDCVAYPPALNHHEDCILSHTLLPAPLPDALQRRARELALEVVSALDVVGLCVVEMFLLHDDTLLVNELAPRPHNSYHGADRAFETGQFEQHVRAVFDLPLGSVEVVRPTAMANLLGDLWLDGCAPDFRRAFAIPSVRVQLYGKGEARPGRKLGHLTATGETVEEALARVQAAYRVLAPPDCAPPGPGAQTAGGSRRTQPPCR